MRSEERGTYIFNLIDQRTFDYFCREKSFTPRSSTICKPTSTSRAACSATGQGDGPKTHGGAC